MLGILSLTAFMGGYRRDALGLLELARLDQARTEDGPRYFRDHVPTWSNMGHTGFLVGEVGEIPEGLVYFHRDPSMRHAVGLFLATMDGEHTALVPADELQFLLTDPLVSFHALIMTGDPLSGP